MTRGLSIGLAVFLLALNYSSTAKEKSKAVKALSSKYEHLDLFSRVLDIIEKKYYRKVDTEKLMEGAIRGMFQTLDPHSSYLDKKALKKMKSETSGKFGGLGLK